MGSILKIDTTLKKINENVLHMVGAICFGNVEVLQPGIHIIQGDHVQFNTIQVTSGNERFGQRSEQDCRNSICHLPLSI